MALLGANYFRVLGCEFGTDKVNSEFNDPSTTCTTPGSWFEFFAVGKDSFNDYEQVEDRFNSTKTSLDDKAGKVHLTQLSTELLPTYSTTKETYVPEVRTLIDETHAEKQPVDNRHATEEAYSLNKSPDLAHQVQSEAPPEKIAEQQHIAIPKPVSFLCRIYELRKAFKACHPLSTTEEAILTRDIGLDDVEILLWFESEESMRSAWSEPSTCKVSYSRLLQRREQMQPRPDSFLRQVRLLREAFQQNSAPSIPRIEQIASEIGLEDFEVSFWFETERAMQLECLTMGMPFQPDLWSPQFSHDSVYSRSSLTGTSPVSDNVKLNHPFHPEPGVAGNLHLDLAQWEAPSLTTQGNKRRRDVHTSSNATSASLSSPPDKRLRRNRIQGSYPCLFESCCSIAADVPKWKDHQLRLHFPKRVWICWLKKDDNSGCKHGPVTRADNFVTHLVNEHHQSRGPELQRLVQSRGLNVRDLYHEECGFCNEKLKSWEDSMNHISGHLSRGSAAESWEHRCSTDHDLLNHIEYQPGNQAASYHDKKFDDEDERNGDADEKGKGIADSTFGGQNQNLPDPGCQPDQSQNSGDPAEWGPGASSTQEHAANYDMLADCQDISSNTATISIQADEIDTDYVSLEVLGHGGFSVVDKIVHRLSRKTYARKTTYCPKAPSSESVEVQFQNEIEILKTLQHPHLIKFIDAYVLQDRLSIIMTPVADESLTSFMSRFDQFPPVVQQENKSSLWRWISCLASALAYLHDHLIQHQDIKPSNILVRGDQIFLTDFGNAKRFLDNGQAQICGLRNKLTVTPMYCPPEAMKSGLQGFTADVFSLGCVYAEIITLCLDETLADFELFRSPNRHDGAFRNQLEKTIEWIESLREDYRQAALQHQAPPVAFLELVCRMLDQDPEHRPTARQIRLKLLPCTCYSATVTAIEMTEKMTPLYPSCVESALAKEENSNTPPRNVQPGSKITMISELEEHSPLESEQEYGPRISSIPKGKMQTVPRPAHISDSDSDTDKEEVLEQRHPAGKYHNMRPYSEGFRNTRRVTSRTPAEVSRPHVSLKSGMGSIGYLDRHTYPYMGRKIEDDRLAATSSDDSSSEDQNAADSDSDVYSMDRKYPTRNYPAPSSERSRGKAPRRDIIRRQHTQFDSFDEPCVRYPNRTKPRGRFQSPRPMTDTATAEDSLARAFAAGYSTGIARHPQGRQGRSPTPLLERGRPLSQSPPMSRSPSPSFERVRRLPSPALRGPTPPFTRLRRPPSPPLRRPSPPLTSASCSVRTGSSIVSPSTEATSPRDSLGSCVSIDEGSLRRRDDFRTEVAEHYINRIQLEVRPSNDDQKYFGSTRGYDHLVGSHSKQLLHYNQGREEYFRR